MRPTKPATLALDTSLLKPGLRLAVGLSGGADSVALLCALAERRGELGLVLHAAHLHHGLRGDEADGDLAFARALASRLGVPFHEARVDAGAAAKASGETLEEAARSLRYGWFRQLLSWTEGLAGIAPKVETPEGRILRPLLAATRVEVEAYLGRLGQDWREDSSNRHLTFTRNRIRHELLPLLESWNPRLREHLAQMAQLARDEEIWWQAEVLRWAGQLILPGRPVRGGGRASAGDGLALDVTRLVALAPALERRLLRHCAEQLGAAIDFPATEALRLLAHTGHAGQKLQLAGGLRAERTPRELRLALAGEKAAEPVPEYSVAIPGEVTAPAFGVRLRIEADATPGKAESRMATLRNWRPGDRVRLRYSSGPHKVKEVLERLRVTGASRALWPVLEAEGRIVWMRGVELEPAREIRVVATSLQDAWIP